MKKLTIFTPSGISSFFEAHTRDRLGRKIEDPLKIGSRGGGFAISSGTKTTVEVDYERKGIDVYINGKIEDAKTSRIAVELTLKKLKVQDIYVKVSHEIQVPTGSGFGTSASGALGIALSLSHLLNKPFSLMEGIRIAHMADVLALTGLGTAEGFISGGCVLITKPGAPGYGEVDKILFEKDLYVLALYFGPISKEKVLKSEEMVEIVNKYGHSALMKIKRKPTVESLLKYSREFAERSGIGNPEMLKISDELKNNGAIGATQNMIGMAVHSVVRKKNIEKILKIAKEYTEKIIVSKIYEDGPKFL